MLMLNKQLDFMHRVLAAIAQYDVLFLHRVVKCVEHVSINPDDPDGNNTRI